MQPLRPYEKEDTLKQFLQFDRNVLRFYCVWDDCDRLVNNFLLIQLSDSVYFHLMHAILMIIQCNSKTILSFQCLLLHLFSFCFSMFGDSRDMELHYFLADDTVEICERIPNNSGRDAVPMFLRRQRLPKV